MKRILIISASAAALACSSVWAATNTQLQSQEQKLSYSLGVETGKAFKTHDVKVDPNAFAAGMADAVQGNKYQLSDGQRRQIIKAFQQNSVKRFEKKMQKNAQKNLQIGNAFLAKNKQQPGIKTMANGLQYKVIKQGSGPMPTASDTVVVNYEGMTINKKIFDSSYKRGKPAIFPVGGVIKGWQQALTHMKVGSTWQLFVPAKLAYGKLGAPGIGPNQTLIFKIHLIRIKK